MRCRLPVPLERPACLAKVFSQTPHACLGLARWRRSMVGTVAAGNTPGSALLKFIEWSGFLWSMMPAESDLPMITRGWCSRDRQPAESLSEGRVGSMRCQARNVAGAPWRENPLQVQG